MDKSFLREIAQIIKDMEYDYICGVKYVIFFMSKLIYNCKQEGFEILNFDYEDYKSTLFFSRHEAKIFTDYNFLDLNDTKAEQNLYNLLKSNRRFLETNDFNPGNLYEQLLTSKEKKSLGQVYTPLEIIIQMLEKSLSFIKIDKHSRFLDPSCGGGYFLTEMFRQIKSLNIDGVDDRYILENMIYGIDIDDFAIFLAKTGMLFESGLNDVEFKIFNIDYLTDSFDMGKFDIIAGNPPYVGHKNSTAAYKKTLYEKYPDVFYDKSDISYCFFKKSADILKEDRIMTFITSRYFMEAMYADKLRKFLKQNFQILSLADYSGNTVFKDAMISPAVIILSNNTGNKKAISYVKYNGDKNAHDIFNFNQDKLKSSGWIILRDEELNLFERIEEISNAYIKDVCTIKQGIITGLDKAFIVDEETIEKYNIESYLLKKWIKNSNIRDSVIKYNNLYLIYSNNIKDEEHCPNAIKYLSSYREKLENRRECQRGYRRWFDLQWERIESDFENPKIIFPYKAKGNYFYYDKNAFFCSADVYFANGFQEALNPDYLVSYLNSSIFEFYFKCQAKKVGNAVYEYYPNKLNNVKIYLPQENIQQNISDLGKISIEIFLKKVFNISEEEVNNIINKYVQKR
ncbi:MAG: TaqI-like C-terminal specificity domain-containing protein [Sedimentibacter saalensis]|uniref:Eco57I restriction-modification methylase domain-containing protein n=1 Tax=Sedimentibacter saalensis TaxID=130788 RepID=UPI002B20C126|nr:Eco57I restriction-modification methylase domain-containing protein [Sedimentibacter saalensis]MEA5093436.1 TaqI-like C-terminal specificity domain-containing protein [Sedimentibacter saalensis]